MIFIFPSIGCFPCFQFLCKKTQVALKGTVFCSDEGNPIGFYWKNSENIKDHSINPMFDINFNNSYNPNNLLST